MGGHPEAFELTAVGVRAPPAITGNGDIGDHGPGGFSEAIRASRDRFSDPRP